MSSTTKSAFTHDPSATAAFAALGSAAPTTLSGRCVRAVVIGGGTGAPVSIRTLLSMGVTTSAVVAMADDGGSTGILREEADVTPPGDVRKCIVAMAADSSDPLTLAFKYRFPFARNHALGNLLLSALEDASGSFPQAIGICERMLQAQGHVYPSTLDRVTLVAQTRNGDTLKGQAAACHSDCALSRVVLRSKNVIKAYEPAVRAIRKADLIVLGPGSLFTSVIPNLLVPGVIDAIRASKGATVFVCSLADIQGETRGLTARQHVEALMDHGMRGLIDYMLVHALETTDSAKDVGGGEQHEQAEVRPVLLTFDDMEAIQRQGPFVMRRNLADCRSPTWHDPIALRNAFSGVLKQCRLQQR